MEQQNIYQRLNAVMKAVSYVQKEDKKVNGQYTFVSHDAVTRIVRPHLIEAGIVLTTSVESFTQDGNRTEAVVVLEFVNIDKPDDKITVKSFGYGIDPQDKGPGKAVSYAVKYGILKTLCLETGDDPERASIDHEPTKASVNVEAFKKRVDACESVEALTKLWPAIASACSEANDVEAANTLKAYCASRKAQLTDMAAA